MKYSISDDFEKMFQNTVFYNEKESTKFFQAMQHGFIWAGILAGTSELKHYYLKGREIKMLIKNFDCNNCIKREVCKYKEVDTPEILFKIEGSIDNEYCPPIINFTVSCKEFQKIEDFLTRK